MIRRLFPDHDRRGVCVLPETMVGMMEQSATRSRSTPRFDFQPRIDHRLFVHCPCGRCRSGDRSWSPCCGPSPAVRHNRHRRRTRPGACSSVIRSSISACCRHMSPGNTNPFDDRVLVQLGGQVVGVNGRMLFRVGRFQSDFTLALRAQLQHRSREGIEICRHRLSGFRR